jgi:hypothetical protein
MQHYTLNTVEMAAWCNKCGRETPHHVAERRLQYCKLCMEKPRQAPAPTPEPQPRLF